MATGIGKEIKENPVKKKKFEKICCYLNFFFYICISFHIKNKTK